MRKMKIKERHLNIELSLARKSIAGNKKIAVEIFLLFSAAFFLIQSIFVLTDSVRNTLLEQRMNQYGEWEYSLPGNFVEQLGGIAEQSGLISVSGMMRLSAGGGNIPVGYYDQEALDMARLTLVEGRLPEKSGEIAVEMETLLRMGLPYDTGMELEVKLGVLQKVKDLPDSYIFTDKTFKFTISGVIKSFSSGWATAREYNIPQAIVTSDTEAMIIESLQSEGRQTEDIVTENYSLFTLKHGQDRDSLKVFLENAGIPSEGFISNTKTYPINPYSVLDGVLRMLYIACSLIACCLLLMTVDKNISLQRASWRQLLCLGADRGQVRCIILWQCMLYVTAALPCGLLCGIAAGSSLIALGSAITGTEISLRITGEGIFYSLLTGLAVTAIGAVIPAVFSKKLYSDKIKRNRFHNSLQKKKKKYRRDRLPYGILAAKTFVGTKGRLFLIILSAGIYLAVLFQIIMKLEEAVSTYQFALDMEADYKIGDANLTEDELDTLRKVPGVEEVIAVKESRDFYLYSDSNQCNPYFDAVKRKQETWMARPGIETNEITTTVIGIEESNRNDKMLMEEYGLTQSEVRAFYRGDFICVFLPDLYVAENPGATMAQIYEGYFSDSVPLLKSTSLIEGDVIRLTYVTEKKDITGKKDEILRESREFMIGSIARIYTEAASRKENVATTVYGIIMSENLLEEFSAYSGSAQYQRIWIKTNGDATYESTDKEISALAAKAKTTDFINTRMIQEERFDRMLTDVSGLLFIMVLLTLLLVLILYHLFTLETEHMKSRLSLLECLGIRRRVLWKIYIGRGILAGILCCFTAFLGYLAMLFIQARKEAETGTYSLFIMMFRKLQITDWLTLGTITALFLFLLIILACAPVNRILKRGIAENIS